MGLQLALHASMFLSLPNLKCFADSYNIATENLEVEIDLFKKVLHNKPEISTT